MVAAAELAVFMVPANVMCFLPRFYFGGLTAWIGQDILKVLGGAGGSAALLLFAAATLRGVIVVDWR